MTKFCLYISFLFDGKTRFFFENSTGTRDKIRYFPRGLFSLVVIDLEIFRAQFARRLRDPPVRPALVHRSPDEQRQRPRTVTPHTPVTLAGKELAQPPIPFEIQKVKMFRQKIINPHMDAVANLGAESHSCYLVLPLYLLNC